MSNQNEPIPRLQYVYRMEQSAFHIEDTHVVRQVAGFRMLSNPLSLLPFSLPLLRELGWKNVFKTAVKLLTPRRYFFTVLCDGRVAHHGWVTIGRCRYYQVEPEAAVVGPVETNPEFRGRGLATTGLASIVAAMAKKGFKIQYIDTADTNHPMQRVIEKCGFGKPVSTYPRPEAGL